MYYDDYDKECSDIRSRNSEYLDLFEKSLAADGLAPRTIRCHLSNADFYINDFLLYYEPLAMESGISRIDMFLGDFLIRKRAWSTPGSIKTTATSIKKFYKCMTEHGFVEKSAYERLCSRIKDGMESWQADCVMYNDPDSHSPFAFYY